VTWSVLSPMLAVLSFHHFRYMNKLLNFAFTTSYHSVVCFFWLLSKIQWRSVRAVRNGNSVLATWRWLHVCSINPYTINFFKFQPVLRPEWPITWHNSSIHFPFHFYHHWVKIYLKWWDCSLLVRKVDTCSFNYWQVPEH